MSQMACRSRRIRDIRSSWYPCGADASTKSINDINCGIALKLALWNLSQSRNTCVVLTYQMCRKWSCVRPHQFALCKISCEKPRHASWPWITSSVGSVICWPLSYYIVQGRNSQIADSQPIIFPAQGFQWTKCGPKLCAKHAICERKIWLLYLCKRGTANSRTSRRHWRGPVSSSVLTRWTSGFLK